jgi:hypothetical protein
MGQLTALAFVAAMTIRRTSDDPETLAAYLARFQVLSVGRLDYVGGNSKCGTGGCGRFCTKPPIKLKDWAFAIARRSTMCRARIALALRLAIVMHAMLRDGTEFAPLIY